MCFCGARFQGNFFAISPNFRKQIMSSKGTQTCWKQWGTNHFLEEKENFSVFSKKIRHCAQFLAITFTLLIANLLKNNDFITSKYNWLTAIRMLLPISIKTFINNFICLVEDTGFWAPVKPICISHIMCKSFFIRPPAIFLHSDSKFPSSSCYSCFSLNKWDEWRNVDELTPFLSRVTDDEVNDPKEYKGGGLLCTLPRGRISSRLLSPEFRSSSRSERKRHNSVISERYKLHIAWRLFIPNFNFETNRMPIVRILY